MNAESLSGPHAEGATESGGEVAASSGAQKPKAPALNLFTNRAIYLLVNAVTWFYTLTFTLVWGAHVASGTQFTAATWIEPAFIAFYIALLVALVLRLIWRGFLRFKEEWWLGEVAKRVSDVYNVDWALISQATRYMPLPKCKPSKVFKMSAWRFELSNKSEWMGTKAEPTFRIVVPGAGSEIVVEHRPSSGSPWKSAPLKSDPGSETVK